jgi:hypothetical protein
MKSFLKIFFSLCVIVFFLSSCGKKNEVGKMIPSDALFVAQLNIKSLSSKVSWNEIKQTSIYNKMRSDSSGGEWKNKLLDNPSSSGIDFDDGVVFFAVKHPGEQYVAAEGKIKNEKDFETFNKNFDPSQTIKSQGNIKIFTLKDKNVVGWNDDRFVYVMNPKYHGRMGMENDASANTNTDLSAICVKLFSLKADSSLAGNDKFKSLLDETGDAHLWQNTEAIVNSSSAMGMLGMLKLDAFTKDNISTYTISFDKGKIAVAQKMFFSKDLTDIVKKYIGNSINMDMVKKIPSQNVFGLLAFNFKPEGITELIKLTGADGIVNSYAQQFGFTLDDFSKATNGEWLMSFSDLKLSQDSGRINPTGFNFLFTTGISNKASLEKMVDAAKKMTPPMRDSAVNFVMNDKTFAVSNNNTFATEYLNSSANNKYSFADKISGHPVGFFLDLHGLLTQFSSLKVAENKKDMLDVALKTWDNIISTGGEFKDNGFTFVSDINLINKDSNSLKQITNYLDQMYKIHEEEKAQFPQHGLAMDSLLMGPPVDTVK